MRDTRHDTSHIPSGWGSVARVLVTVLVMWGGIGRGDAAGQSAASPELPASPVWCLVVADEEMTWDAPAWPIDSLRAMTRRALTHVQRAGYYQARIDSVVTRTNRMPPRVDIFVRTGPQIPVGTIRLHGADAVPASTLRRMMTTKPGAPLDPARLEADIDAMLDQYEAAGRPLAHIRIAEIALQSGEPPSLHLTLDVDEGPALWLKDVRPPPATRTSAGFIAHAARLDLGAPLADYDPNAIRQRLQDTGLFETVGEPTLHIDEEGAAILDIPLDEKPPGTFDLMLGYLPPGAQRTAGQIVGSGHLQLENLFGGGRTAGLAIDRRPGRVSTASVRVADPYVLGLPVRVEGQFAGEQRDSTFSKQAYHLTAGYHIDGGTEVFGSLTREGTQPGQAGTALQEGVQQIPRSSGWFTGLGVRVRRVDRSINPRRGFWIETTLERGQKNRRFDRRTADGDTVRIRDAVRQERLNVASRFFVPTWSGQLIAWGIDASVLRSGTYDRSDLFRFGGAATLRGYDEDRFVGNVVGRVLMEYRYQIDRASFAYLFGDLGMVDTPELGDVPGRRGWHPGYGLGIQVSTDLGLVRASYALNPDDTSPTDGRIHLGLSVGL
jgi:outer membrane protein assembly factor BamA